MAHWIAIGSELGKAFLLMGMTLPISGCAQTAEVDTPKRQAVEQNLLPAIVLAGQAWPSWGIEERMARYHVPGISIAVISDGEIDWANGYGIKLVGTTDAVSDSTLFNPGSIVKPVVAVGALRLVQEGKLDLDEDVNLRLRSWKIPANEYTTKKPVTLRGLLSHTAGVTVPGFKGYARHEPLPTSRQILDGNGPANSPPIRVDTEPGRTFRYSGGGYQIAKQLIEDVTRESFNEVIREKVLKPFAMTHSTFAQPLPESLASSTAKGHNFAGSPVAGGWNIYPELAAAGLWCTPTDLARFGIGVSRAFQGKSEAVLNQNTAMLMLTKVGGSMGLGVGVHGKDDSLHFDHSGWNRGFRSYMVIYPRTGNGVVVMTNGDSGHDLIGEIVKSVARVYGWPGFEPEERASVTVDVSVLEANVGEYYVSDYDFMITVKREGDHLFVTTPRGSRYTFYPATDSEYFAIEDGSTLTFAGGSRAQDRSLNVWGMSAQRLTDP